MADLLGEVDTNLPRRPAPRSIKTEARRKTRVLSPSISENRLSTVKKQTNASESYMPDTPPALNAYDDDDGYLPTADDDAPMSDLPLQSSPVQKAVERKSQPILKIEEEEEDLMEVAQPISHAGVVSASINMAGKRPVPKIKKMEYPTPISSSPAGPATIAGIDASSWNDVTNRLNVTNSPAPATTNMGKVKPDSALEEDGSLRMFWTDYTEVNGSLCLFGKVKDKTTDSYVSCFVKVDNILRKLYFLPREHRHKRGQATDEEVEMSDVYEEVDDIMTKHRVGMHMIKPCTRKYAFELPDIPKEADYLKLLYPYDKMPLATDMTGETFSHVFGTNTSLFEQFVLWKNVMGPCWLNIEGPEFNVSNASWCKLELQVSKPKQITVLSNSDNLDAPPLTLMSISLRTSFNAKDNKQEVLMVSAMVYENFSLTNTTPPDELPCKSFTIMRPHGDAFPAGFKIEAEKQKGSVILKKTEQDLLSYFMAMFQRHDPDVLIGHRLDDVDYTVLLNRMREKKTPGWHRIGRLRRSDWPKNMGKGGGSFYVERQLAAGRLLCDLANDLGKSLMTKCQSWSLEEMCQLVLGKARQELDNEAALKTWATTKDGLMNYVKHCQADAYFIAAISIKVQALPLTKVLTNLAGNSWARTLSGTRAERNEYILLHEFHKNKYICPDKAWGKGKPKADEEAVEGEEGVDAKKKDKYKGGLVFEPEKGLYDKFIIVMDFNSLYPSIIQEYNICFTTIERSDLAEDDEKVPEVPSNTQDLGILPRLIATLVNRRREVKKLMKSKTASPDELATWDIKQLALKLTANSMYGCLGYTKSRFYARPLAMLTTHKGREILRRTKDMAEAKMLRVIYGDTDSVMINTNVDNIQDALKLGNEFKKEVNDSYKLLEIDIDNVFRRILLHAKKKYAAINMVSVDGKYIEKLEVKGLDMRRREYCALSKETSTYVASLYHYLTH
jgi:DNA polymerase alpha subunit A